VPLVGVIIGLRQDDDSDDGDGTKASTTNRVDGADANKNIVVVIDNVTTEIGIMFNEKEIVCICVALT
jgi:hypothetical protein